MDEFEEELEGRLRILDGYIARAAANAERESIDIKALHGIVTELAARVKRLESAIAQSRSDRGGKIDMLCAFADVKEIEFNEPKYLLDLQRSMDEYPIRSFGIPKELRLGYGGPTPRHPSRDLPGAVDLNRYLRCFPSLRMEDGCVLDYLYGAVRPYVYARRIDEPPLEYAEYKRRYFVNDDPDRISMTNAFLKRVKHEISLPGIFEFAIFAMTAHIFYLQDHGLYEYTKYIFTPDLFMRAFNDHRVPLNLPDDAIERAKRFVGFPRIKVGAKNFCRVSVMIQEMGIGVAMRHIVTRNGELFMIDDDVLVPPNRVMFF